MKIFLKKILLAATAICCGAAFAFADGREEVKLGGNAFVTSSGLEGGVSVTDNGVRNWTDSAAIVSVFFSFEQPQKSVKIFLKAAGKADYEISVAGKTFRVRANASGELVPVADGVSFPVAGYQRVDIRRVFSKNDSDVPDDPSATISALVFDNVSGKMDFVRDRSLFYWGRRGASVHLIYPLPPHAEFEYFYNEITVPENADVLGSYFMACGFGEGYFGMQVNSAFPGDRRVLFSVWSPFETQNPAEIPKEFRITPLKIGEGVRVREFGSEGAGGQSFLRFPWRAGTTYKFLLRVRPDVSFGATDYTAWFFAPEENKWKLIASFRRPATRTWLCGAHSFLENFLPATGWRGRNVVFSNQWVRDKNGNWHELTEAAFSCDETGASRSRLDFDGGVSADKKSFTLRGYGFFNGTTKRGTVFHRESAGPAPEIGEIVNRE